MTDDEAGTRDEEEADSENGANEATDPDGEAGKGDPGYDGPDHGPSRSGEFSLADDDGEDGVDSSPSDERQAVPTGSSPEDDDVRGGTDADAPLSSLASSVEERRGRSADEPDDELFREESVPEIDADVVWDRLEDDDPPELPDDAERDVRVVEKRSYCEQCPFFSEPPEVSCTHDGTEILELVDMDHFRVVDCPKVREDERLERL